MYNYDVNEIQNNKEEILANVYHDHDLRNIIYKLNIFIIN